MHRTVVLRLCPPVGSITGLVPDRKPPQLGVGHSAETPGT
jgi:hypothetical protein